MTDEEKGLRLLAAWRKAARMYRWHTAESAYQDDSYYTELPQVVADVVEEIGEWPGYPQA